jgi:predicted dehydrogenase
LRALREHFEVRAVYEPVAHRAEQVAAEFNAAAVDGFRALAHREDIDAVLMLGWHWLGTLPILAACEASKAVYSAAGLGFALSEGELVKRRVEETGVPFVAEFSRRHLPATVRLKELFATRLGPPRLMFCHQRAPRMDSSDNTATARNSGSSPSLVRELIELVDWCCYLMDRPPTMVTGLVHTSGEEDYQMMTLDFSPPEAAGTGPVAQISCGRYIPPHWQEAINFRPLAGLQVSCDRGIAFVDLPQMVIWFDEAGRHQETVEDERPVGELLLGYFHRTLSSLIRRNTDLEDAYRALCIVHQARRSHQEGRRILL